MAAGHSEMPDLLALTKDGSTVLLGVELRSRVPDMRSFRPTMVDFMRRYRCDLFLVVARDRALIYEDSYRDYSPEAVERVGDFRTPELLASPRRAATVRELEEQVVGWLRHLAIGRAPLPSAPDPLVGVWERLRSVLLDSVIVRGRR